MTVRFWSVAAAAAALVAAGAFLLAQPLGAPWWLYADADATYTGSSLSLLTDDRTRYLDHPGLPVQEVLAAAFGLEYIRDRIAGDVQTRREFAHAKLLDLDRARTIFRGYAVVAFLLGTLLVFVVCSRFLGGWGWGLAGALLWLGAPDHPADSIQVRPDVVLSALSLFAVFLAVRAWERRDPALLLASSFVAGLTMTVKLHAGALLVPLAFVALGRAPWPRWRNRLRDVAGRVRPHWRKLAAAAAVWLLIMLLTNVGRPFEPRSDQIALAMLGAAALLGLVAGTLALERRKLPPVVARIAHPVNALALLAVGVGVALPATLFLDDGLQMLVELARGLTGGGVNKDIQPFTLTWQNFRAEPLLQGVVLFALAGAAALVGLYRRDVVPAIWFLAAAAMTALAVARLGAPRYFAPAYTLAIPGALWLVRGLVPRPARALASAALVLLLVGTQLNLMRGPARDAENQERAAAEVETLADSILKPGEIILAPDYFPISDIRFLGVVEVFVNYVPEDYPYQFLPDAGTMVQYAADRGYKLRYYYGPAGNQVTGPQELQLNLGKFDVRPTGHRAGGIQLLELVSGPKPN